jgi:hypothetical protein
VSSQGNSPLHKPKELAEEVDPIQELPAAQSMPENVVVPPVEEFVPETQSTPQIQIDGEPAVPVEEAAEEAIEMPKIMTPDEEPAAEVQEPEVVCPKYSLEMLGN